MDDLILTVLLSAAREAPMLAGSATKQKILEVIEKLPADATLEGAIVLEGECWTYTLRPE